MYWFKYLNTSFERSSSSICFLRYLFMKNSKNLHNSVRNAFAIDQKKFHFHSINNNNVNKISLIYNYSQRREFSLVPLVTSIASSRPVEMAGELLEWIHMQSGLSWWSTIILTTITLRLMMLPLIVYQQYILAKYENLLPEIKNISIELKKEVDLAVKMFKWNKNVAKREYVKNFKKHVNSLIIRDNCHPFKSVVVVGLQLPTWICLSFALRNMVNFLPYGNQVPRIDTTYLEMTVGGTLWFSDLTLPDQCLIIPIMLGIVNLVITEVHTLRKFKRNTKLHKLTTNLFRCVSIILVPIAITMPSGITLYWLQSSVFGLMQNLFLQIPKVRRFFRIPQSVSESQTPFQDMAQELKTKIRFL